MTNASGYKNLTDEELISGFQNEDKGAYDEIVNRYKDRLVNFLYRYTGSYEDAEDLAQDTFTKVYLSKHSYKPIAKFSTWLYTIAINYAKTKMRSSSRYKKFSLDAKLKDDDRETELVGTSESPDQYANSAFENYYIQKAIDSLDDKYKQAILLRDVQELEYKEIEQITGLPAGTVKIRINRAREKLKIKLKEIYK